MLSAPTQEAPRLIFDNRLAVTSQNVFKRLDAKRRFHGVRQPPRQNPAAEPVTVGNLNDLAISHAASLIANIS
jgi:hypothetical protein